MGKRLILVLALALLVGMTFSAAYAEVQNVKVSGDIAVLSVFRNNFDLHNPTGTAVKEDDASRFWSTQTRVRIDADLTDNVMTTVRLINERRWNGQGTTSNSFINLDLAYVVLKEFLYSPLTLTIGRQEIRFGNQLIIGNSGAYGHGAANGNANLNGLPQDLTMQQSFDGIRATLNYDPLVIDAVYAVLKHGAFATDTTNANDITLMGVNAKYDITKMVSIEGYFWNKTSKDGVVNTIDNGESQGQKKDTVNTIGTLITATPLEGLKTSLEAAFQFGLNRSPDDAGESKSRKAYAFQWMADYTLTKCKMMPSVGDPVVRVFRAKRFLFLSALHA